MERMTRVLDTGRIWPIHGMDEALKKLAAYENTGLEPSEIQPVKRGEWKRVNLILNRSICSMCGWHTDELDTFNFNYCPNCGAHMEASGK